MPATSKALMVCSLCQGEHYIAPTENFTYELATAGWKLEEGVFSHIDCETAEHDSVPEEVAESDRKVL